jgi:putative transposase
MKSDIFKRAPNNPPHLFLPDTLYMLTASIYQNAYLIESPKRKSEWRNAFHEAAKIHKWEIIAWVVLHNHYHAIVQSPENVGTLSKFVGSYHKFTARQWNNDDKVNGRKVWWNYWDTCIRTEKGFENRLKYVFWNPVKHGLVSQPEEYEFSNYRDFLSRAIYLSPPDLNIEVNDVPEF